MSDRELCVPAAGPNGWGVTLGVWNSTSMGLTPLCYPQLVSSVQELTVQLATERKESAEGTSRIKTSGFFFNLTEDMAPGIL